MEKNKILNKKASLIDVVFIGVFLLLLSITILYSYKMQKSIESGLLIQNEISTNNDSKEIINNMSKNYVSQWDYIFIFVLVFLWLGALISGFLIETHPIWFVINIILLLIVLFISMILGNIYETIASDSELATTSVLFPMMNWLMTHFILVFLVMSVTIILSIFAKPQ